MKDRKYWLYEVKIAIIAVVGAILYFMLTFTISSKGILKSNYNSISPELMPRIIGVVAVIVSVLMLIQAVSNYKKAEVSSDNKKSESILSFLDKDKIIIIVMLIIYLLLINIIGYIISTILLSLAILNYLDRNHIKRNIVFSVIFPIACFIIFNYLLQIWLPMGIFFN